MPFATNYAGGEPLTEAEKNEADRAMFVARQERLEEALIDIRNRILCPAGPAPTLDQIEEIASNALHGRTAA